MEGEESNKSPSAKTPFLTTRRVLLNPSCASQITNSAPRPERFENFPGTVSSSCRWVGFFPLLVSPEYLVNRGMIQEKILVVVLGVALLSI